MISRRTLLGAGAGAGALTLAGVGATSSSAAACTRRHADSVPWTRLADKMQGHLVLPGDANYAQSSDLYDQQFDVIHPQAIAYCVTEADVATCLQFAQYHQVAFSVRSGGHSLGGYSTTTGLVVDVSSFNSVSVNGSTVTVGPGAQNVDLTNAIAPYGLGLVAGYHPTVGMGGFYTGGGVGLLTRQMGMGCDSIASARVVLAGGSVVTASPNRNTDLYWAIRGGGGGNFGVITSYTLNAAQVSQIALTNIVWSWDNAAAMLDGFARWLVDAPHSVNGGCALQLSDAAPGNTPTPYAFLASTTGDTTELTNEVNRLLSLIGAAPVQQAPVQVVPYGPLMTNFYGCSGITATACHRADTYPGGTLPRPYLYLLRSRMFNSPPTSGMWDSVVSVMDTARMAGQSRTIELVPFGGAANDIGRTDTAYVHRDALFSVSFLLDIESADGASADGQAAGHQFVDTGWSTIDPYSNGETYQNFIDPKLSDWAQSYYAENYARLAWVKSEYDPYGAFGFAQSIA